MTAINDNGQVYWTFEELDFEGALKEVQVELEMQLKIVAHYTNLWESYESQMYADLLHESEQKFDSIAHIKHLLIILKNGGRI